jgi:mono/diheme cytochrome c family protein
MKKLLSSLTLTIVLVGGLFGAAAMAGDGPTVEEGKKLYLDKKNKCAVCHGEDGKAQTKVGKKMKVADMTTAEWQKRFTDQQIVDAILKGVDRKEGERKVKMPATKGATERDAKAMLLFIRSIGPKS